jgi:hypothetical protein
MSDTPAQKRALRSNPTARKVRARFPEGTRIQTFVGTTGTVIRHVPAMTSLGGHLVIKWDDPKFGVEIGKITPIAANVWPIEKES